MCFFDRHFETNEYIILKLFHYIKSSTVHLNAVFDDEIFLQNCIFIVNTHTDRLANN